MKRRTLLAGIGTIASGSGAIATSAAIAGTADASSSITAIVNETLEVKAGAAFNDDGTVRSSYEDQYVPYPSNDSFFQDGSDPLDDISRDDAPVATVSPRDTTVNNELEMKVALSIENSTDTFLFEDFLRIENNGGDQKDVAIRYDRDNKAYDPNGQYGEDVIVGGSFSNELSHHDVQHTYQFVTRDPANNTELRLSPNPTTSEGGTEDDNPTKSRIVDLGDSIQVDLQIDLTELIVNTLGGSFRLDPKEHIRDAVGTSTNFGDSITTVDLLDAITVENNTYG
ncbi:MAG: hypothetical protein J07HN4v3_01861 [Halonotius sp. J07HN4]|nr:MAG: hypothetical protein J07HN4v3_01861 [Halonotius sp. J07HN4]